MRDLLVSDYMIRSFFRQSVLLAIFVALTLTALPHAATGQARDLTVYRESENKNHSLPALTELRDQLRKQIATAKPTKDPKALKTVTELKSHLTSLNTTVDALQT